MTTKARQNLGEFDILTPLSGADLGKNYAGDFCENIVTLRGRTMVAAEERFLINGHPR